MTKMQIVAKAVLTVLGIYFIIALYRRYPINYINPTLSLSELQTIIFFLIFIISTVLVFYFLVVNNDRLCRKIAGQGEVLDHQQQKIFITKALRIGLFFLGLMMLPAALYYISKIPSFMDSAFNSLIEGESLASSFGESFRRQYINIFGLFEALLAFYLIFGASAFIRWQANRSLRSIPYSERTENE